MTGFNSDGIPLEKTLTNVAFPTGFKLWVKLWVKTLKLWLKLCFSNRFQPLSPSNDKRKADVSPSSDFQPVSSLCFQMGQLAPRYRSVVFVWNSQTTPVPEAVFSRWQGLYTIVHFMSLN
jgi:hypothetical protein